MFSHSAYCIYDVRCHFQSSPDGNKEPYFFQLFYFKTFFFFKMLKVIWDALTNEEYLICLSSIKAFTRYWGFCSESFRGVIVKVVDLRQTWVKFLRSNVFSSLIVFWFMHLFLKWLLFLYDTKTDPLNRGPRDA